jgi:hypothetical protein
MHAAYFVHLALLDFFSSCDLRFSQQ